MSQYPEAMYYLHVPDLNDVVLGVAVVGPDPLLEEHAQREVLLEEGQHVLDRDAADWNPDSIIFYS